MLILILAFFSCLEEVGQKACKVLSGFACNLVTMSVFLPVISVQDCGS